MGKRVNIIILVFIFSLIVITAQNDVQDEQIQFIRGDANSDGKVDISDSVFLFNYLYKSGRAPQCRDFADVNDDGKVDLTDGVYLNNHLFRSGEPPKPPYPFLGLDMTQDDLTCGTEGQGAACFSIACDDNIEETNEGPGGAHCCGGNPPAGFEQCEDYQVRSTAIVSANNQKVDYCLDNQKLNEAGINCAAFGEDSTYYVEKNCNDFNSDTTTYSCEDGRVIETIKHNDYDCLEGACEFDQATIEQETTISRLGADDYCDQKVDKCGVGCSLGEYDCDTNSECTAGLQCLGPTGGASDGCCGQGQIWDTANYECDDCSPTDGPCCDSNGKFRQNSYVCNDNIGTVSYSCKDGNCLGEDVWERTESQYCSGNSASCNGRTEDNDPVRVINCNANQFCDGARSWVQTRPTCRDAQCTEGACCDTTCRVYRLRPNNYVCDNKNEEGCPWGTNLGNDAGRRQGQQSCTGNNRDCTGQLVWGNWAVKEDCSSTQYCELNNGAASCKNIACSGNRDCGEDGFINQPFCRNNNVWDAWRTWTCNNPGARSSSCSSSDQARLSLECTDQTRWLNEFFCQNDDVYERGVKITMRCAGSGCGNAGEERLSSLTQDCQNGCETLSSITARCRGAPPPPTCSDGITNQDETDVDCGGSRCSKCQNGRTCSSGPDCQSNYCNPTTRKCENAPPCTNDCTTQGAARCTSSTTQQTCGNFDADTCLEWGSSITCQSGCSSTYNQCNKPDLAITSFLLQYPRTTTVNRNQRLSLVFTIKNIGTLTANNIFWNLVQPDHSNQTNEGRPISSLKPGQLTSVFVPSSYSRTGQQLLRVIADYQNQINELNENNNQKELTINVV